MTTRIRPALAVLAAVATLTSLVLGGVPATAGNVGGSGSTPLLICGLNHRAVQASADGVRVISRPNPFGTTESLCLRLYGNRPGFRIISSLTGRGRVKAYPFTGVGCAYRLCSPGTDLPLRISRLSGQAATSWAWTGRSRGTWNASYDLWGGTTNQITDQDDGFELMIWLRTPPGYAGGFVVRVAGRRFWFDHWRTGHTVCQAGRCRRESWNYVQFRFLRTVHRVRLLRLLPFLQFIIRRGLARPSWWLTSVHAGYEIWSGGKGLATTWFWAQTPARPSGR